MRIAHLSDLHLSPDHFPERTDAFYEILQKCRLLKTDHIVITGDITNQAKPKEFAHARSILKEFGLLDPAKLTVTIGNHDIFGGPFYAEDVLSFPGFCKQTNYEAKVKEFHAAFHESFEGCKYVSGSSIFPYVKILRDVVFVGINSVAQWSTLRNPLGSNGDIGKQQHQRLKEIFSSDMLKGKTIFVLIHHHFSKLESKKSTGKLERLWHTIESSTMKLWKKKRLFQLFNNVDVAKVLHGHLHHHDEYTRKNVTFLNAGGTMFANAQGDRLFHLLHVQKKSIEKITISILAPKQLHPVLAKAR
ncbi:MAG: metallophosphoesterase [Bacteroidota bacterium]